MDSQTGQLVCITKDVDIDNSIVRACDLWAAKNIARARDVDGDSTVATFRDHTRVESCRGIGKERKLRTLTNCLNTSVKRRNIVMSLWVAICVLKVSLNSS